MTGDRLAGYTVPAVLVSPDDEVRATNEAFRDCAGTPSGDSLAAVGSLLDRGDRATLTAALDGRTADPVTFTDADGRYLPRVVRETDAGSHLLFLTTAETTETHSEAVAHVVSHDLRNPLDVAKAHLQAVRDEHDDDHLESVARAHDRMEEIIRDVLTLARGEDAISPSPGVDLGAVVTDAWDGVATQTAALTVDEPLPETTADRPRVERLVENLLRNAADHAGEAPTIHAGPLGDRDGFYVADDGRGVAPDRREAVFQPGYTASEEGTGLGLAIVRRIADAHGWGVRITESRHGGARVEVSFDGEGDA